LYDARRSPRIATVQLIHPKAATRFSDPDVTADGQPRARVALRSLETLWFNTGTRCNLTCGHCYIESSPHNDRLAYLELADVRRYLAEIAERGLPTTEIGFTGGEPFLNPVIIDLLAAALGDGYRTLVLTNAMRPMMKHAAALLGLNARHGDRLVVRVSLDHPDPIRHEEERGARTFSATLAGLEWLGANGFTVHVAGRLRWGDEEAALRAAYGTLFAARGIAVDAADPRALVLFPEMDGDANVPEITTACWDILGRRPDSVMCATSRMVVRRKGAPGPVVVSCTLLPYDTRFELGPSLADAARPIALNHPHCATFCVLGGASCSVPVD
jgi:uncharacterized Fe-S cluster-containing radical SAM superfamily protein